jgi:hypothetical protein
MELAEKRSGHARFLLQLVSSFLLFLTACTNHYMTKDMMVQQFFPNYNNQKPSSSTFILPTPVGVGMMVRYDSNRLSRVLCYNDKGEKVYVSVNKDTQLIITDKKGVTHKFYLDTVFLQDNALHGLRSRILGMEGSVSMDDIDKIQIYTEFSKETPVKQSEEQKTLNE